MANSGFYMYACMCTCTHPYTNTPKGGKHELGDSCNITCTKFLNKDHGNEKRKSNDKYERKILISYQSLEANEMSQRDSLSIQG